MLGDTPEGGEVLGGDYGRRPTCPSAAPAPRAFVCSWREGLRPVRHEEPSGGPSLWPKIGQTRLVPTKGARVDAVEAPTAVRLSLVAGPSRYPHPLGKLDAIGERERQKRSERRGEVRGAEIGLTANEPWRRSQGGLSPATKSPTPAPRLCSGSSDRNDVGRRRRRKKTPDDYDAIKTATRPTGDATRGPVSGGGAPCRVPTALRNHRRALELTTEGTVKLPATNQHVA